MLPKLVTSWKLAENFAKLSKGCFSRSHTWFVYIQFLITISSPWFPWSKGEANVWTMCREWATTWKTIIVSALQIGNGPVRMYYCTAIFTKLLLLTSVFSYFCCYFHKKPMLPSFSAWNFLLESYFISILKKMDYCCFHYKSFNCT